MHPILLIVDLSLFANVRIRTSNSYYYVSQ